MEGAGTEALTEASGLNSKAACCPVAVIVASAAIYPVEFIATAFVIVYSELALPIKELRFCITPFW